MLAGAPLGRALPGRIGLEIRATVQGGLRILERIERARLRRLPPPAGAARRRLAAAVSRARPAMTPDEYCQQKAAASGSSFYYSFLFLPPERRRAITALYAFCREVDDVVDECADPQLAAHQARVVAQRGREPVRRQPAAPGDAALCAVRRSPIGITRAAPERDHRRHGDGPHADPLSRLRGAASATAIASPAWSACSPPAIFGYRDPRTLEYAKHLGIAFQLTNIIRDVGEDARKNRIYLPMEELQTLRRPGRGHPRHAADRAFRA